MEEDNKFKPLSCQVRNNMETTIHVNDCKFHKSGKWSSHKNWLENWFECETLFLLLSLNW